MSKIVQAVNAMISNPENISTVIKGGDDLFFRYKNKYTWSMTRNDEGGYALFYYPENHSPSDLAARSTQGYWEDVAMVSYRDSEIGTKEAKASFAELFTVLEERVYGVHNVLNDIISDVEEW